jgi:hypothetical protein
MTRPSFLLVRSDEGRHAQSVSCDGGATWGAPGPALAQADPGHLIVGVVGRSAERIGVGAAQPEIWAATVGCYRSGSTIGLPPTGADLACGGVAWGAPARGATISIALHLDMPLQGIPSRFAIVFVDGQPVASGPDLDADVELRCPLFVGLGYLLRGLAIREVIDQVEVSGDLLALTVATGAVARVDVVDSHRWVEPILVAAERARPAWEPALRRVIGDRDR